MHKFELFQQDTRTSQAGSTDEQFCGVVTGPSGGAGLLSVPTHDIWAQLVLFILQCQGWGGKRNRGGFYLSA